MNQDNFEAGDVVKLKSGGPNMTIENFVDVDGVPHTICRWYAAPRDGVAGAILQETIATAALKWSDG